MVLDGRPERGHRGRLHVRDGEHGVRIAKRDRPDLERAPLDFELVRVARRLRGKGQGTRVKVRYAHVDRDRCGADARVHHACGTVQGDGTVLGQPAVMQQGGDAARAVAALFDLVAVGVEDAVEHGRIGPPGAREHQRLIEADAGAAIGEAAQALGLQDGFVGWSIKDDEIVADPVHLREIDAHRAASIAQIGHPPGRAASGLQSQ
jgi:hypothetical protein